MKNGHLLRTTLWLVMTFVTWSATAQQNIQEQYKELYEKSSTWEDYKVIKLDKLGNFWSVMTDSLEQKQLDMRAAKHEIMNLEDTLAATNAQLAQTEAALGESEGLNDSISFLGLQLGKTVYNIIVWTIILVLAAGLSIMYLMYQRSNALTRKTRKDHAHVELELKRQKDKYREMQIKLKRELQTALNSLSEQRV